MFLTTILMVLTILSIPTGLLAQFENDPMMGTWKGVFDNTRQTYMRKQAPAPGGFTMNRDGVDAQGNQFHGGYTGKLDGKYYPVYGDPNLDEISFRRVDGYTYETRSRIGGKPRTHGWWVVSHDGKWLTIIRGAAPGGNREPGTAGIAVFEKVSDTTTGVRTY